MPNEAKATNRKVEEFVSMIKARDVSNVDYDVPPLEGSTEYYEIRPTIMTESGGDHLSVYGLYNVETGVREHEIRQLKAAQDWCKALTKALAPALPGLETDEVVQEEADAQSD